MASESITETGRPTAESAAAFASACARLNSVLGRLSRTVIQAPTGSGAAAVVVVATITVWVATGEGWAGAEVLCAGVLTTSTGPWERSTWVSSTATAASSTATAAIMMTIVRVSRDPLEPSGRGGASGGPSGPGAEPRPLRRWLEARVGRWRGRRAEGLVARTGAPGWAFGGRPAGWVSPRRWRWLSRPMVESPEPAGAGRPAGRALVCRASHPRRYSSCSATTEASWGR